jgi:L-asparagine oxygenase
MERHIISLAETERIRDALRAFAKGDAYDESTISEIREAAGAICPDRLWQKLDALRRRISPSGSLLIHGLEPPSCLPPTPVESNAMGPGELTLLSEVMELAMALLLGEPVAYQAEKNGALVQHVFPVRSEEGAPSNESSDIRLDLHTELVFSRRQPERLLDAASPDFILLYCLRSDPGRMAETLIAEVADICARVQDSDLAVLREPRFELRAPYSFTRDDPSDRPWVGPVSLLGRNESLATAAFDLACGARGADEEAGQALAALREAASEPGVVSSIRLEPGDLLILDNRRCVHGRTRFTAYYDGNDRWIQRIYVRLSLDGMEPFDRAVTVRVF